MIGHKTFYDKDAAAHFIRKDNGGLIVKIIRNGKTERFVLDARETGILADFVRPREIVKKNWAVSRRGDSVILRRLQDGKLFSYTNDSFVKTFYIRSWGCFVLGGSDDRFSVDDLASVGIIV